jgi:hypothetical protein
MVFTFKSKTLITDLYSMNPPDSRDGITFCQPIYQVNRAIGKITEPVVCEKFRVSCTVFGLALSM